MYENANYAHESSCLQIEDATTGGFGRKNIAEIKCKNNYVDFNRRLQGVGL